MSLSEIKNFLRYYNKKNKIVLMAGMEYRADYLMSILSSYSYNIMALFFLAVVFQNVNSIAGWSKYEVLLMYGTAEIMVYIYGMLFAHVGGGFPRLIYRGDFDMYLLKPINALLSMITHFPEVINAIPNMFLALAIVAYSWAHLDLSALPNLFWYILFVGVGIFINLAVRLLTTLTSFWFTDSDVISNFYAKLSDQSTYIPADVYPGIFKIIVTTIVPFALIAYAPTVMLLHGFKWGLAIQTVAVLVFFWVLDIVLWNQALKKYSSAGS